MKLAIDFGTSRTRAAVAIEGKVHPVVLSEGGSLPEVQTAAFVDPDGTILVGEVARRRFLSGGKESRTRFTDWDSRYFAGRRFKLQIDKGPGPSFPCQIGPQPIWQDLVAAVLKSALSKAEHEFAGHGPTQELILTVPAMYVEGGPAWRVMEKAGSQLGIPKVTIIREPHAAARWFGHLLGTVNRPALPGDVALLYDLGGGTFDPTVLEFTASGYQLLSTGGESDGVLFGGTMIDELLEKDFAARYPESYAHVDPKNRPDVVRRVRFEDFLFQSVKHRLAVESEIHDIEPVLDEPYRLSRNDFEIEMVRPLLEQTLRCCEAMIERDSISWSSINRILMVGGTCRLPIVKTMLEELAQRNGAPSIQVLWRTVGPLDAKPELAVALGAAVSTIEAPVPSPPRSAAPVDTPSGFTVDDEYRITKDPYAAFPKAKLQ